MIIKVKEKEFYIKVEDEQGRIIYENWCLNRVHYEYVKYLLLRLKEGKKIENNALKPMDK